MTCGKPKQKLVQISTEKPATKADVAARPPAETMVEDFYCDRCTLLKERKPQTFAHRCQREKQSEFELNRLPICNDCEHNVDGICMVEKQAHPERDCVIAKGVKIPYAHCKAGKWGRVGINCPECGRYNHSGTVEPKSCKYCGWQWRLELPRFNWEPPAEPTSRHAIATVVIGDNAQELAEYTLPRIRAYADRCGADLIVIDKNQCPEWPIANKFTVASVGKHYDRTLFVDIDCWIDDEMPNVFRLFATGSVYMHRDRPHLISDHFLSVDCGILSYSAKPLECWNTGVVLFDRDHASIWAAPQFGILPTHTLEQSWVEIQCHVLGVNIQPLPLALNLQWWMRPSDERWHSAFVRHLANATHDKRMELLNSWNNPTQIATL